jgi:N-acetylmuramoyl-L-alanine amidase
MIKYLRICIFAILILGLLLPYTAYARDGDFGYEGGISSGEVPGMTPDKNPYQYQEVCFVTGEPIVFLGTLTIKKSLKTNIVTSTYTYNLNNIDKAATLTRVLTYSTKLTSKANGQVIEETTMTGLPKETIKIGNNSYILKSYQNFTRSSIIDSRPAINYYSGNLRGVKTYQTGTGTNLGTVTVEETGKFYGYDQYWSTAEAETLNVLVNGVKKNGTVTDKWGGSATINLSVNMAKEISYVENQPDQISFKGGYVQTQSNNSILEYNSSMPEFDSTGISNDNIIEKSDSLKLETFPVETRLMVPNLTQIRGNWAENDIKILYSLEVLNGDEASFNPQKYISRAEFTAAIDNAAKAVPGDPMLTSKTPVNTSGSKNTTITSPFNDVLITDKYFSQINDAFKRGLISGNGKKVFAPNNFLTLADTLTIFIRALGLESLAPNPAAVTTFVDNDKIPAYARNAAYVAERIGLIQGDDKGYLKPNDKITAGRAAVLIDRFINYMRSDISKDYTERAVNYN